jgi:hypothetical protein
MQSPAQRSFACSHCEKPIYIPHDLPPTRANCPHCSALVTSPALPSLTAENSPTIVPRAAEREKQPIADTTATIRDRAPGRKTWLFMVVLLTVMITGSTVFYLKFIRPSPPVLLLLAQQPAESDPTILSLTWQNHAREVLGNFFQATTAEEKARYVIGGLQTVERLRSTWGDQLLEETAIPVEDFAPIFTGSEEGIIPIYLLMYDRPVQYQIKTFFRPLVSMEVMQGAEQLDPLTKTLTDPSNFEQAPLKVQIYLKPCEDGLRLDYDLYLQTRYRTLQQFVDKAPVNAEGTFRVVLVEDAPLPVEKKKQLRIYRITDPVHLSDSYRCCASSTSEIAQKMSDIHWYGIPGKKAHFAAATVTLRKISAETILLEKLVCWDFDGLAGTPGNSLPRNEVRKIPSAELSTEPPSLLTDP